MKNNPAPSILSEDVITVQVLDRAKDHGAIALIAPVGINTDRQTFLGFVPPNGWDIEFTANQPTGQLAAVLYGSSHDNPKLIYRFTSQPAPLHEGFWHTPETRHSQPSVELESDVADLIANSTSHIESLNKVVQNTAARFSYDHYASDFNEGGNNVPSLRCGLTPGSCVDINTYLVASCRAANLLATYCAGYSFPIASPVTDSMHCWVATLVDGARQDWDIAEQLIAQKSIIEPGYDTRDKFRYALSFGRDLEFRVRDWVTRINHFAEPEWVLPNGKTVIARHDTRLFAHGLAI